MPANLPQPDSEAVPLLEEVVGYLNFSSGTPDPSFLQNINELFRSLESARTRESSLPHYCEWLRQTVQRLEQAGGAFTDAEQAKAILDLLQHQLLPAYTANFTATCFFTKNRPTSCGPFSSGAPVKRCWRREHPGTKPSESLKGRWHSLTIMLAIAPWPRWLRGTPVNLTRTNLCGRFLFTSAMPE